MVEIFNLIRGRTLLFSAFVMYMMRYFVVRPILEINYFELQMSNMTFCLLVFAIACIIAAANIINDYFDARIDRISEVRHVVVGRHISRRAAISLHTILNIIAMTIIVYLSIYVNIWKIAILFFLITGILWFYSSTYKRYFITANLLVGILAALIPFIAVIFEIPLLNVKYAVPLITFNTNFVYLLIWISGFSYFIFLNTWMYEINKDIYSIKGDVENRVMSIPVRLGIPFAKQMIAGIVIIAIISVVVLYATVFYGDNRVLLYMIFAVILPYIAYIIALLKFSLNRRLQLALIRIIMITCIFFSFLIKHFLGVIFQ